MEARGAGRQLEAEGSSAKPNGGAAGEGGEGGELEAVPRTLHRLSGAEYERRCSTVMGSAVATGVGENASTTTVTTTSPTC